MILLSRTEILSCLGGIPAVLKTFHKLYQLHAKGFIPARRDSGICNAGISLFPDEIFL